MSYNSGKKFGKRKPKGIKRRSHLEPVRAKDKFKGKVLTKQQAFLTFDVTDEKGDITEDTLNHLNKTLQNAGEDIEYSFMLISKAGGNDLFHCWHEGSPSYTDKVARYAFAVSKKGKKGMIQTPHFNMMMRLLNLLAKHPKHTFMFLTGYKDKQVGTIHFPGAKMISMQYAKKHGYLGQMNVPIRDANNEIVFKEGKPQFKNEAQYAPFSSLLPNVFFTVGVDSMEWKTPIINAFYLSSEFDIFKNEWSHTPYFWDVKRAFIITLSEKDNLRYDRKSWRDFLKHSWMLFDLDNYPVAEFPKLRRFIKLANNDGLAVKLLSMPKEWVKGEGKEATDAKIAELQKAIEAFETDEQTHVGNKDFLTTIYQRDIDNLKTGQYPMVWPANMRVRQYPLIERTDQAKKQIQRRDEIVEANRKAKEDELKKGGLVKDLASLSVVHSEHVKQEIQVTG